MGTSFDRDLWRERAWARYQRAQMGGRPQSEGQWAHDIIAISNLEKLIEWCTTRGLTVTFTRRPNGIYDSESKAIQIAAAALPAKQLMYLLHECGHHLIGMKEHHERFGMGYPQGEDPVVSKTTAHKVACLEEEFEAWHRGWKLSRRLGLAVSRQEYDNLRIECLKSYVDWTAASYKRRKKQ